MRKLILILSLLASPAFATGLKIDIEGEANGTVMIDLYDDVAPGHVAQITALAAKGAYDGVVFHRVMQGFMAQTGDVQFGNISGDISNAGFGGSDLPDLKAEFSQERFLRGVVGMARSNSPDSANSQFFIVLADSEFLNGQYTVVGKVSSGMDVVDAIKFGNPQSGAITGKPDVMVKVTVTE